MTETLTSLSRYSIERHRIQFGPNYPEVIGDREIGGPADSADRRLILDVATLESLLDAAKASLSQRVVLHRFGVRVQLLRERDTGHRWELVYLLGSAPQPEATSILGSHK